MGEKSGLRATVSTPSALIFSSALAGSAALSPPEAVLSLSFVVGCAPQATRLSAMTSASSIEIIFFMGLSILSVLPSPQGLSGCGSASLSLMLHTLPLIMHKVKGEHE